VAHGIQDGRGEDGVTAIDTDRDIMIKELPVRAGIPAELGMATPTQLYIGSSYVVDTTTDKVIIDPDVLMGRTPEIGPFYALLGAWNR
jgi:hypothetical protein